jgi:hypothetical protein
MKIPVGKLPMPEKAERAMENIHHPKGITPAATLHPLDVI